MMQHTNKHKHKVGRHEAGCFQTQSIVRFIARVCLSISLLTSNFPVDTRHQLGNFASLQTFKSPLLSVCLDGGIYHH